MATPTDPLLDRYTLASAEFERRLRCVRADQWNAPTPCTEWTVRQLVNHMARGNLGYLRLVRGGSADEFLRLRDADALGADPTDAYRRSVRRCAAAFREPGALDRTLDYPLGAVSGRQALAVRTTDSVVHTWDLAVALGLDDRLDAGLVDWVDGHLDEIYAGLAETPVSAATSHRFFAAPRGVPVDHASRQDRLLHRMGRTPDGVAVGPGRTVGAADG
ncbi:MAG: TIGR03086 family metal-binding protein [Actinocatenispora sp.]